MNRTLTSVVIALALAAAPAVGAPKKPKPAPAKPTAPGAPAAAAPSGKDELAKAEKAFEEFNYGEAEKALVRTLAAPDNERATVLRAYELRGIIDATTGKKTALDHFRRLVAIDPEHQMSRDLGPRILQPFYEAKARLDESPPIKVAIATVPTEGRQTLSVAVQNDSLQMAQTLKLFYRPKGGSWESRTDPAKPEPYEVGVNAEVVEYYAQLLGPNDATLIELGSEAAPLVAEPKAKLEQVVVVKEVESRPLSTTRKLSIGVMGVGVATIIGAIAAGAVSSTARNEIENPQRDEQGRPIGMTPEKLSELQSRTTGAAIASNVLWVSGGILAGLGLVLFIADPGGGAAKIAVSPSAGGVMASGEF
jgi:hypothetical protein